MNDFLHFLSANWLELLNLTREHIFLVFVSTGAAILLGMVVNFYKAPRKDNLTVCRALPGVFHEIPGTHFLFVHSGGVNEDQDKIKACVDFCEAAGIRDCVHFLENRFPAIDVVRALDVFVFFILSRRPADRCQGGYAAQQTLYFVRF